MKARKSAFGMLIFVGVIAAARMATVSEAKDGAVLESSAPTNNSSSLFFGSASPWAEDFTSTSADGASGGSLQAASIIGPVERMPRNADSSNQAGWWVPLAVYNGASYFVYDSPDTAELGKHGLAIGKRDASGSWTFANLKNPDGTEWTHLTDDPGHRQPTIAIDGDGYIHVWADMHSENWRYFRSSAPGDISDIRQRSDMPGSGTFTYPVAKTAPNGDVWLFLRNGGKYGELYHWTNTTNVWTKISTFASSAGAVVYPDDIVFSSDGTLNLLWEWAYQMPRALRHYGSFLRYKPSTGVWSYIDGTTASLPISLTSSTKLFYLPLQAAEVFSAPDTAIGLQSAKVALDPNTGWPSIAYRFRPTDGSGTNNFDVWRVRWDGSSWTSREKVYAASNDVPAGLGLTRNGSVVRIYFATFGGGMQRAVKTGTTPWSITALAPGKAIERVNVVPLNSVTDIIYGGAPTDIDANTGSVYWQQVSD